MKKKEVFLYLLLEAGAMALVSIFFLFLFSGFLLETPDLTFKEAALYFVAALSICLFFSFLSKKKERKR